MNTFIPLLHTDLISDDYKKDTRHELQFIYNNKNNKISNELKKQLQTCDSFKFSIAFIKKSGLAAIKQELLNLQNKKIPGKIITSTYLVFNDPETFYELLRFTNIETRVFESNNSGFHPKGYIFSNKKLYNVMIGSSNLTQSALSKNEEWNIMFTSLHHEKIVNEVNKQFEHQWNHSRPLTKEWIEEYKKIYVPPNINYKKLTQPTIEPNKMQKSALRCLESLRLKNKSKALIISATGTGKTLLSAFDVKAMNPNRMLFVVHRETIAKEAMNSFKKVIPNHSFGILTGSQKDTHNDYLFATVQTISKKECYQMFVPGAFEYIVIDEVHRAGSKSYQQLLAYFKPKFLLGMSATPERRDGFDIYQMFDNNIAYEIRLKQAMEYNLLCPFHYYGVIDLTNDGLSIDEHSDFNALTSNNRVEHIIGRIKEYGHSGERVRGLIFCSRTKEAQELSILFNQKGYNTIALTGSDDEEKRRNAINRLETDNLNIALDYIFTVDLFNEGIDIPKVNQIIMLRATESATIFVQQLGRGLRKDDSKEYTVVIDFIGNYTNNFMIPIALSGDYSYNKDSLRRFMNEGTLAVPGSSTINFDLISKERIYKAIDMANFSDIKIIKENYQQLKLKLGKIPNLIDFDKHSSIDVLRIFEHKNLGSYHSFLSKYESEYTLQFNELQIQYLEYISRKFASGKRIHELEAIKLCIKKRNAVDNLEKTLNKSYNVQIPNFTYDTIRNLLTQQFATGAAKIKYKHAIFVDNDFNISPIFYKQLQNPEFKKQIMEVIDFGISRYKRDYKKNYKETDFCLYKKYTYDDVCRLLNWNKSLVPVNIGGYRYDRRTNTFPVFINYDKEDSISETTKYNDHFINPYTLIAYSKSNRTLKSKDVNIVQSEQKNGTKIHLFVRKNKDDNTSKEFYYLGLMRPILPPIQTTMDDQKTNVVKFTYQLENAVQKDIFEYFIEKKI